MADTPAFYVSESTDKIYALAGRQSIRAARHFFRGCVCVFLSRPGKITLLCMIFGVFVCGFRIGRLYKMWFILVPRNKVGNIVCIGKIMVFVL